MFNLKYQNVDWKTGTAPKNSEDFRTRNVREECVAWLPPNSPAVVKNWSCWVRIGGSLGIWSTCYPRIPILYRFAPSLIWDSRFGQPGAAREAVNPKNQFKRCCNSSGAWRTQWTAHHGKVITVRLATADPQRSVSDQKIGKRFAQTFQIWRLGALYHICLWKRSTLSHMFMNMII